MVALVDCTHEHATKHGRDRHGRQRWKCQDCGLTFTANRQRPLGDMRTDIGPAAMTLQMLLEGMSIRAQGQRAL